MTPNYPCVTTYLTARLKQLGVRHLFSVPGDYSSDFLAIVDYEGQLTRIGNCNELNAAYAADGYARTNGLGAVSVTAGVGASSALNAIAGSYIEMIPVVLIVGTYSNQKRITSMAAGELFHHNFSFGVDQTQSIYRDCTVAFERISDPLTAGAQIDRALVACLSQRRPVAIEILEDCYAMPCDPPQGALAAVPPFTALATLQAIVAAPPTRPPNPAVVYAQRITGALSHAAQQAHELLTKHATAPVIWIGAEVGRYGLQDQVTKFIQEFQLPWGTSLLGKGALSEAVPGYVGVYDGALTQPSAKAVFANSDCILALGVWHTDLNEFAPPSEPPNLPKIWAAHATVKIVNPKAATPTLFSQVSLAEFLSALSALLKASPLPQPRELPALAAPAPLPPPMTPVTYDGFAYVLGANLTPQNIVVADIGLSTFGVSSFLPIVRQGGFICQAIWASIGWSVPAGLGASFTPGARPIVIVGDGAFRLTCQEISTMVAQNTNTVIFVLCNGVYGVEQILDDASTYRDRTEFEAANILPPWDYISLFKGFANGSPNAYATPVFTIDQLQRTLTQINATPTGVWFVAVALNTYDYPSSWRDFVYPPALAAGAASPGNATPLTRDAT